MTKRKIADSIIIRVGGGIREVRRESFEKAEKPESVHMEPGFEQTEDTQPFGVEQGIAVTNGPNKIIN
jgi:hypothetical protein